MNLLPTAYTYTASSILNHLSEREMIIAGVVLLIGIVFYGILPFVSRFLQEKAKSKEALEKKQTIADLRLMKELQTEIEADMKQALIRASLLEREAPRS